MSTLKASVTGPAALHHLPERHTPMPLSPAAKSSILPHLVLAALLVGSVLAFGMLGVTLPAPDVVTAMSGANLTD